MVGEESTVVVVVPTVTVPTLPLMVVSESVTVTVVEIQEEDLVKKKLYTSICVNGDNNINETFGTE